MLSNIKKLLIVAPLAISMTAQAEKLTDNFEIDGRLALTVASDETSVALKNNSSRFGISYSRDDLFDNMTLGVRYEFGINASTTSQEIKAAQVGSGRFEVDNNNEPFSSRLSYLYMKKGNFEMSAGKNWSTWYDVTATTDIFLATGSYAAATFDAATEVFGTGRATDIIQARYKSGNFHIGAQTSLTGDQETELADSTKVSLEAAHGMSLRYKTKSLMIGLAGHTLERKLAGDKSSYFSGVLGFEYKPGDFLITANYNMSKRLVFIEGDFADTNGLEAVIGYNISKLTKFLVGYNTQDADNKGLEEYELNKYMVSFLYEKDWLAAGLEVVIDDSTDSSGSEVDDNQVLLSSTIFF